MSQWHHRFPPTRSSWGRGSRRRCSGCMADRRPSECRAGGPGRGWGWSYSNLWRIHGPIRLINKFYLQHDKWSCHCDIFFCKFIYFYSIFWISDSFHTTGSKCLVQYHLLICYKPETPDVQHSLTDSCFTLGVNVNQWKSTHQPCMLGTTVC